MSNAEHERFMARMGEARKDNRFALFVVVGIVCVCIALALVYGRVVYGQWRCGLPGVQCRILVEEKKPCP